MTWVVVVVLVAVVGVVAVVFVVFVGVVAAGSESVREKVALYHCK